MWIRSGGDEIDRVDEAMGQYYWPEPAAIDEKRHAEPAALTRSVHGDLTHLDACSAGLQCYFKGMVYRSCSRPGCPEYADQPDNESTLFFHANAA